jgi:DNA-binding beta-propeller fold protein YncE
MSAAAAASNAAASCLKVTANIAAPATENYVPRFSAMDPVTDTLYLASPDLSRGESFVYVVSGATNTVETTITVPSDIQGLAMDTQTDTLYATVFGNLVAISGQTDTITSSTYIGPDPVSIALDQKTQRMYVKKIKTITTGLYAAFVGVNPVTDRVYIPFYPSGTAETLVISGQTNQVIATIDAGGTYDQPSSNTVTGSIAPDPGTRDSYVILYRRTPSASAVAAVHDSCTG